MSQQQGPGQGIQLGTFQVSGKPLAFGAALIGAGVIVGMAGVVLSGSVVLIAAKRWIDQLDTPPSDLAKQKWAQARAATTAATTAGASAWQNGLAAGARNS
jgi:hypothetical protein